MVKIGSAVYEELKFEKVYRRRRRRRQVMAIPHMAYRPGELKNEPISGAIYIVRKRHIELVLNKKYNLMLPICAILVPQHECYTHAGYNML